MVEQKHYNKPWSHGRARWLCGFAREGKDMGLGTILLLAVLGLVVIMLGSCVYFAWSMQRMVMARLRDLDSLRTDQLPPESWQKGYLKRARKRGAYDHADYARQKRRNMRKLMKMIKYARQTRLMESDEVREGVLEELRLIEKQWREETFEDVRR